MTPPPAPASAPPENSGRRPLLLAALLIAAATLGVYANTLPVPFLFDDIPSIIDNPSIRKLWPLWPALAPPSDWGVTVSGRPVLNLSLALNYAISGREVWSYHVGNTLIHVLAGLTLLGIVRRTLLRPPLAVQFGDRALPLALVIAGLWTLHPLQTESVTYVIQRAESLMGLFFLATLYAFIRAVDSPRPGRWRVVAFFACLLGVGTKELGALAPVMVLLYDRTFVSGSFRAAWQRHRGLHLALAATWLPLAWLLAGTGGNRGGTIGFDVGVSWVGYWLTQFEAVTRYLGLAFWPHPLVFDYGKVAAPGVGAVIPWAIPVLGLGTATLVALWRRPVAGFLGAWFFVLLAPTSLVPGTNQMIVEHRMYLPLAAVIALVLGGLSAGLGRRGIIALGAVLALAAAAVTVHRNSLYLDPGALWRNTLAHRPGNSRAHNNLGLLHYQRDRLDEAIACYREALRFDPGTALVHFNLGIALIRKGSIAGAVAPLEEAVRLLPGYADARLNLGMVLTQLGRTQDALPHLAEAVRLDRSPAEARFRLGVALADLGRWRDAAGQYAAALQANPAHIQAHSNLGVALFRMNSIPAAIEQFNTALRLQPDLADVHFNLGVALANAGRPAEAFPHYAEAVRLDPQHALARLNLGIALAQQGNLPGALEHLGQAARLRPDLPETHTNLALALAQAGETAEALAHYREAARLRPGSPQAHYNLGYALLTAGQWHEARAQLETALQLQPDFPAARELLRQMQERGPPP